MQKAVVTSTKKIGSLRVLFILLIFLLTSYSSFSQSRDKVYAVFLLNFARYIEWPAEKVSDEFIIGVLDYSPLATELKNVAKVKTVGKQRIRLKEFQTTNQIDFCHILFIPKSNAFLLTAVQKKFANTPMLIITEKEGLAKKGSGINFLLVDGKVKFELNNRVIEACGMKTSPVLSSLGILVN